MFTFDNSIFTDYNIVEIMAILKEWIENGDVVDNNVLLFYKKSDGKFIPKKHSYLLIEYMINNLEKYYTDHIATQCDDDKIQIYSGKYIKSYIAICKKIKQNYVLQFSINKWLRPFEDVLIFLPDTVKHVQFVKLKEFENNIWGISITELFNILYNFYYKNISITFSPVKKEDGRIDYNIGFNIEPFLGFTQLNDSLLAPSNINKMLHKKSNRLKFSAIKDLIQTVFDCEIEINKNLYSSNKFVLELCKIANMNFKECLTFQVLANIGEFTSKRLFEKSDSRTKRTLLSKFYNLYSPNENDPNHTESPEKNYYNNRLKIRNYTSFKEKISVYGKNINIEDVTDFSSSFYLVGMNNTKLLMKPTSRIFNQKMTELFKFIHMYKSGSLIYYWEYVLKSYALFLAENDKSTQVLKDIDDDISPIIGMYMANFIKHFREAEKWYAADDWSETIKDVYTMITNLEKKCTIATTIKLLYIYSTDEINEILLEEDCHSIKNSLLDKELSQFFAAFDDIYHRPNNGLFRRIKLNLSNSQDDIQSFQTKIEEAFEELSKDK